MALLMTDEEIALFAKLPRAVLTDIVKAVARMPHEYWGDLVGDLELSEKRQSPGCIHQKLHHDQRGQVHTVDSNVDRRRQARRKAS